MKYADAFKRNSWLILAVLAFLGLILAPSQAHSQPFQKIPGSPVLRLPPCERMIKGIARFPSPATGGKVRIWVGSRGPRLPQSAVAADKTVQPETGRPGLYARTLKALEPEEGKKAPELKKIKKIFDNDAVRSSVRLTLPEDDLAADLGL